MEQTFTKSKVMGNGLNLYRENNYGIWRINNEWRIHKWTDITGQPPSYRDGKFFPYKDTEDNWTIGYGTILTDDEASEYHDSGITMEAAEGFLNERLTEAGTGAGRLVYNLSNMPTAVQ